MGMIKELLKPYLKPTWDRVKSYPKDRKAERSIMQIAKNKHNSSKPLKVGFIVFEPETWDKIQPVFVELKKRDNVTVHLIVVPSFDHHMRLTTEYGHELDFFMDVDPQAIKAYDANNNIIDMTTAGFDYIFYQDPYNVHMPEKLRSDYLVDYCKICYIPYGTTGSNVFIEGSINRDFTRNVYLYFADSPEMRRLLERQYKRSVKLGVKHIMDLGYPAYDSIIYKQINKVKKILWTPRWSYDPVKGGSHFFEYKDHFILLKDKYPDISFVIRPHPMMFSNFIREGRMTEDEKSSFIKQLHSKGIILSESASVMDDLVDTDILVSDFSSIIPMFFFANISIVYCDAGIPMNDDYTEMARGFLKADNWNEVEEAIESLIKRTSSISDMRERIVMEKRKRHIGSIIRTVDTIIEDYNNSAE